jgi:hypothetical protein
LAKNWRRKFLPKSNAVSGNPYRKRGGMSELMMIIAVVLSPLIAVQVTQWLNSKKEAKARRIDVFSKLMAMRATPMNPVHVEALNRIDIEFFSKKNEFKKVLDSWKKYHDHLNDPSMKNNEDEFDWKSWNKKNPELLTNLLYEMSQSLGYNFDEVTIKRGHYFPKGLGELEDDQLTIRRGLAEIFSGKKMFPVLAFLPPTPAQNQPSQPETSEKLVKGNNSNKRK